MFELLKEIWSTARRNKLRTSLTGFAVAWGIFMIIFLLGAGNGLINAQLQQSERHLANSMTIYGGQTSKPHKGLKEGRRISLKEKDVNLTSTVFSNNVDNVGSTLRQGNINISYRDNYVSAQNLAGVYPSDISINKREMLNGRYINDIDMREMRKVIVLTETQAKELLTGTDYTLLTGRDVKVGNLIFRVVGIMKDDQQQQNDQAMTPYSTLRTIYGRGDEAGNIQFKIKGLITKAENEEFEKNYRARINSLHDAAADDPNAIWIRNHYTENIQMADGISIIRTALWIIGIFTLLSGIVGVSNIMLITVKERTREFGIRKAIGAHPWHILRLIITESVITTAFFGYTGMICGVAANEYMDATIGHEVIDTGIFQATMFVNPTVGLDVCFQATLVIIIAGTIAGLIPAIQAAKVRPIEALRAD